MSTKRYLYRCVVADDLFSGKVKRPADECSFHPNRSSCGRAPVAKWMKIKHPQTWKVYRIPHFIWSESPGRRSSEEPAVDGNRRRFRGGHAPEYNIRKGVKGNREKCARSWKPDKGKRFLWCPPTRDAPSLVWSSCILECSLLQALSIDRLSLMDVLARSLALFLSHSQSSSGSQ